MTIRFDDALQGCAEVMGSEEPSRYGKIVLVRDFVGKIHVAVEQLPDVETREELVTRLKGAAEKFWSGHFMVREEMVAPEAVFFSPDLVKLSDEVFLLERGVTGADWRRQTLPNRGRTPPRAALFGLKGGVGRSTALCIWARYLANQGKRVLVVDLDLESPGVSSLLLAEDSLSDYGVVDWFVERAVDNADQELLRLMVTRSPIGDGTAGEVLVAPCHGSDTQGYIAKLSRAYVDLPDQQFGDRVGELIDELEEIAEPDIVLLDSRSGLHDIAAVATTRLGAMTFLFAGGSRQTWDGYRILLDNWAKSPSIACEVRERLRVVAALIPETDRERYLERLRRQSYDLFADRLYEEAGSSSEVFNFDIDALDAPHYPLNIYWSRTFQEWNPLKDVVPEEQVYGSYSDFLKGATDLVIDSPLLGDDQ